MQPPENREPGEYTVLHDVATGALVVDVTGYRTAFDPELWSQLGAPALLCFGTHPGRECALGRGAGSHKAAIEMVPGRSDQASFARRLSEMLDESRLPLSVSSRRTPYPVPDLHAGVNP